MKKNRSKAKSGVVSPAQSAPATSGSGVEAPKSAVAPVAKPGNGGAELSNGKHGVVEAKIDVGFGNQLFIRGGGAGLSWAEGKALDCEDPSTWIFKCEDVSEPFEFKLLINDQNWCIGANYTLQPGATMQVIPHFVS